MNVLATSFVEREAGHPVTCPLCRVQSTADVADTGWVALPELRRPPQWLCLGCWLDMGGVVDADDPAAHPFYNDWLELADLTGMGPADLADSVRARQLARAEP